MNDPSKPGVRLRAWRESQGLSRSQLGERLGTTKQAIEAAENGKPRTLNWWYEIATTLGLDPHDFDERLASTKPRMLKRVVRS